MIYSSRFTLHLWSKQKTKAKKQRLTIYSKLAVVSFLDANVNQSVICNLFHNNIHNLFKHNLFKVDNTRHKI